MFSRKVQGNGSRAGPRAAWMEAEHRVQARGLAAADEATSLRARLADGSMAQLAGSITAREELAHRASSPSPSQLVLCSSDELGFDAPPLALAAGEAL